MYVDPFLSEMDARLTPPPFPPASAPRADLVFVTHDHIDHLDDQTLPALARSAPEARFVLPAPLVSRLVGLGIPERRIVGARADEAVELGAVRATPIPAMHAFDPPTTYGFERDSEDRHAYVGYILQFGSVSLYHAGDTVIYDGLVERLRRHEVDLGLLPINGRSYFREQDDIVGNMDEREAAELAGRAGFKTVIPIHYDMFAGNLGRPGLFVEHLRAAHPGASCVLPALARRYTYIAGG